MMNNLLLMEGEQLQVDYMQLKKGTDVCLQPTETKFIELKNPQAVYNFRLSNNLF